MKIVFWIFAIVAVVFTIDFVMTNGQPVALGSWLLPWQLDMPVGLTVLCAFVVGLVVGGLLSWGSGGRQRRRARAAERRAETLERELGSLVRRAEEAEREAITVALPEPAQAPGGDQATPDTARATAGGGRQ
jgi:uncharacterized integral membrane protein